MTTPLDALIAALHEASSYNAAAEARYGSGEGVSAQSPKDQRKAGAG